MIVYYYKTAFKFLWPNHHFLSLFFFFFLESVENFEFTIECRRRKRAKGNDVIMQIKRRQRYINFPTARNLLHHRTIILREISSTTSDKTREIPVDNVRRRFCKSTKASVASYIRQIRHEPFTRHARMAERESEFASISKSAGVSRSLAAFWRTQNRERRNTVEKSD